MAAGGAVVAAMIQAIKASGVVVKMDPAEFTKILFRSPDPLVVSYTGGIFTRNYQYLTSYKGLAFFTKSPQPLDMPAGVELITAKDLWMPG